MKLKPLNDSVLVKVIPPDEKSPGGLFLPGHSPEFHRAFVVAVSEDPNENQKVKVGDKVLVQSYVLGRNKDLGGGVFLVSYDSVSAVVLED